MDYHIESKIANFYSNRSVFITGATGFMGKVLVEKLLRSCPQLKNIYVLLRNKKGLSSKQRLEELLNNKLFDNIRSQNPKLINKVVAVQGDITLEDLGISTYDMNTLIKEVSIVFHSAATVKFDEPLKTSIEMNVIGTRRVITLCSKMVNIVALIHVSSAYANCNLKEVDEILYPSSIDFQKIIDAVKWMNDDLINHLTPKLLENRPNIYTYTKALAEDLLIQECGSLPVAIVRPSIVCAAWREPLRGWVDNLNGPTGLIVAHGKGILRTMLHNPSSVADLIPVDSVINLMITVAWYTATRSSNSTIIYNCTSGLLNPITWYEIEKIAFPYLIKYPSLEVFRYPGGYFKTSRIMNDIFILLDHYLPAYIFDCVFAIFGRKQIMIKLYAKLHRALSTLEWFTVRTWKFKNNNVMMLCKELEGVDKEIFHFDIRELNWEKYWEDYSLGIRNYILKEDDSTLPLARKKLQRLYYANKIFKVLIFVGVWYLFVFKTQSAQQIWLFLSSSAHKLFNLLPNILKFS